MTGLEGSCHCGNLRFTLGWPSAVGDIPVRACTCSFCSKHGARWTSHPDAELQARAVDWDRVNRYRFGTETAEFLICEHCGAVPLALSKIGEVLHCVVNVNTLHDHDRLAAGDAVSYDDESTSERLARRQGRWISRVVLERDQA